MNFNLQNSIILIENLMKTSSYCFQKGIIHFLASLCCSKVWLTLAIERPISRYFFIPGSRKLRFLIFSEPGNPSSVTLLLLARLRRPLAAFLLNEAISKGANALWTKPWRNFFKFFEIMVSNDSMKPKTLVEHD